MVICDGPGLRLAVLRLVSLDVSQTESVNWTVSSVSYKLPKTERAS